MGDRETTSPSVRPVVLGVVAVAALSGVYLVISDWAQHPLAILVVPVLVAAALARWPETLAIAVVATGATVVLGTVDEDIDGGGLTVRLAIIVVAGTIGTAVAHARENRQRQLEEAAAQRRLIDVFQSSLVPRPVAPAGVRVDVRYRAGDRRLQLGGDFVDAITLPDGSLGFVIGDVCGQGAEAAALGAALRAGWKTVATRDPGNPAAWLDAMDSAFFRLGRRAGFATVNTGRLDLATSTVDYVSAGHPWPVVADGAAHVAVPSVGPPLGVAAEASYRLSRLVLARGATLLLYTDGLVENPRDGVRPTDGEAELVGLLSEAGRVDLDALLSHFGPDGFADDVAAIAITVG